MKAEINKFFKNVWQVISKPEMAILPGQLAYFFVLAVVPTITLITYGAALLNLSTDVIYNFLSTAFSEDIATMLLSTNSVLNTNGFNVIIVIFFAYYISSNGASSIIVTSNAIYGITNNNFIERRLKAFVMIFILLFLFLFMLIIPMFGDRIIELFQYVNMNQETTNKITLIIKILQGPFTWFIIFLFIKLIYTMAPDKKIKSRQVNYGAIFTTTCWVIVTWAYSIYLNNYANYDVFYGSLANLVILMLWFYFLSLIFTIGMALNFHKEEEEHTKKLELK